MPEPTVAELFRLDELLKNLARCASCGFKPEEDVDLCPSCHNKFEPASQSKMLGLRFRRLWAAYAVKFGWPFSDAPDGLYVEDAVRAWRCWAGLEEKYSL